jgi:hypothetical protein
MDQQDRSRIVYDGVVVPQSPLLKREQAHKYGSIEDLSDEELADPDELERMVYIAEFGPVLQLPGKGGRRAFYGNIDEDGRVDFGAFGTVDFDRQMPEFDKARYRLDKLKEELKNLVMMLQMVNERITGKAKYKVLKYVQMGVLELGDIADHDMYLLAEMYLRAVRLRQQIAKLQKARKQKMLKQRQQWLDSLGG